MFVFRFRTLWDYKSRLSGSTKISFYAIFIALTFAACYFVIFHYKTFHVWIPFLIDDNINRKLKFENYGFHPVNDRGVYSFWNVCIESSRVPAEKELNIFGTVVRYNESKQIVIYDSLYREGDQRLYTAGSPNSYSHDWDITFTRGRIPASHTFHPATAFFIIPTCPSNFHHFWIDEFVPLYGVIKQGNRLKPGSSNRLFYKQPVDLRQDFVKDCTNVTTFETILKSLYIQFPHDTFFRIPDGSCFSSGVFGSTSASISSPREAVEHVLRTFNNLDNEKRKTSNCSILFLDRNTRRILNIEKLLSIARSQSTASVCRLVFEDLSVEQQLHAASHARVMIGVQGAGLQWAAFMLPSSHLVEIAWPQKHWGFYFHNYIRPYGIIHHKVVAIHVKPNWTTYENQVRGGLEVKMEEKLKIMKGEAKNNFDHFWKWADVIVNEDDIMSTLRSIIVDVV